jgi:hypothetical protein
LEDAVSTETAEIGPDPNPGRNRDHDEDNDEVIDRFNRAFQERDATLLEEIIAMRVVDGKIVEAAGYSKTAPTVAALES